MASKWKIAAGVVGGLVGLAAIGAGGAWLWVNSTVNATVTKVYDVHVVDFPVPFPLSETEIEALRAERSAAMSLPADPSIDPGAPIDPAEPPLDPLAGVDLEAVALERAVGSSRVDLQACKLEYSIVSPK